MKDKNIMLYVSFQNELDVSVRQRAVDLLYAMCDNSNATEIVTEMLDYLKHAVYSIKEELVSNASTKLFFKCPSLNLFKDPFLK